MCDPVTLGVLSVGMSAIGAFQQSAAQKAQAEYQSAVARNNAQIARNNQIIANRNAVEIEDRGEEQAQRHEEVGRLEANRYRSRVKSAQADQMVSMAGQGADVTVGNNVDLLAETAAFGELDAQTIAYNAGINAYDTRYGANRKAYNTRVQGMNYAAEAGQHTAQAGLYDAQAKQERPLFSGLTTALSGASSVAGKWSLLNGGGGGGGLSNPYLNVWS